MPTYPDYVFSLTTIPGREQDIKATLQTLTAQTVRPAEILIYVPRKYRRPELTTVELGELPPGCRVIHVDEDLGPATKVLYAIRDFPDTPIIYCDDDRLYEPVLAERLLDVAAMNPGMCVASNAQPVAAYLMYYSLKRDAVYRAKRIASLGLYNPKRMFKNAPLDIVAGFGGVLVESRYFDPRVYDIPENFWLVDDIWLSGNLALAGTRIASTADRFKSSTINTANEANPLHEYVFENMGREALDRACIEHFQKNHGIWLNDGGY
ncbi:MAG: hypothetical protein LCH61_16635 [Proteobacteria bacterium]|nr:hypothetical protein [Pseudomonadota bacterium]